MSKDAQITLRELWQRVGVWDSRFNREVYAVLEALVEAVEPGAAPTTKQHNDVRDATILKLRVRLERERNEAQSVTVGLRSEVAEAEKEVETLRESRRWWKQRHENAEEEVARLYGITSAQRPRIEELEAEIKLLGAELAEAEASLERLHKDHRFLLAQLGEVNNKTRRLVGHLDEAKAEIGRLATLVDSANAEIERLRAERDFERGAVMMGKPLGPEAEAQFETLRANAKIGRLVRGMRSGTRLTRGHMGMYWSAVACTNNIEGKWESAMPGPNPAEVLRAIQETAE